MALSIDKWSIKNRATAKAQLYFAGYFLLLFAAMQVVYNFTRDTLAERIIIDYATVTPSVALINTLTPTEHVSANGHQIKSKHIRLSVLNGCEGVEAVLLLVAAIVAFSAPWRHKVMGIVAGTLLIYLVNQIRIVSLYYAAVYDKSLFNDIHGYVGPTLIIILACLFFLFWVSRGYDAKSVVA